MTDSKVAGCISAVRLRQMLDYDPETGTFRWKIRPAKSCRVGASAGSIGSGGYVQIQIDGRNYLAHRLAWLHVYGAWPEADIDHINLEKNDNRIANLRLATPSQNMGNTRKHQRNKSGIKGVHFCKQTKKWRANIQIDGRERTIGRFASIELAAEAYRRAAICARGAFARTED